MRKSTFTAALILSTLTASVQSAEAEPAGELIVLQWIPGSELDAFKQVQDAFVKKYPSVTVREITITWSGDPRGSLRAALMGGEAADIMVNTWPSFREELAEGGLLRPLDEQYTALGWDKKLDPFWKDLGSTGGIFYGLPYNFGHRSGLYYRTQTLANAGVEQFPATWESFMASFQKLKAKSVTPVVVPAKFWAHTEIFESLLLRVGGADLARKLATHEAKWTDEKVKSALRKFREMIEGGCCDSAPAMLGTDWDNASDKVLKDRTGGYVQLGMWISNRATEVYQLDPKTDFGFGRFPALGLGHDNASSLDSKEIVSFNAGSNPEAADAFMDFMLSQEVGEIYAKAGLATPSKIVDQTIYPPAIQASNAYVASSDNVFVLGDSLPGDLTDEYRIQLQKFLQDPSDKNIDQITAAIEAKAEGLY